MFSYYGAKTKIVKWYPEPKYATIIEPFAGAARYSLYHSEKNPNKYRVILVEANPKIAGIWQWLKNAKPDDLRQLPIVKAGEPIPDVSPIEARWFIGLCFNQGSHSPKNFAGRMNFCKLPGNNWESFIKRLPIIQKWEIHNGDYSSAPDIQATWYVDPPYSQQKLYPFGQDLDYTKLGDWCKSRKGQVIVAENDNATWLPFQTLGMTAGQRKGSKLLNEGICIFDN